MRADMPQVLVERPRGGCGLPNASVLRDRQVQRWRDDRDPELPSHAPMTPRTGPQKHLNENLSPLLRFLRARVGRPWDKVYSEIRAHLDSSSAVQMHICQHLFDYVHRQVTVADGQVHGKPRWGNDRPELFADGRTFYVHPATGVLSLPRRIRARRTGRANARVVTPAHLRAEDGRLFVLLLDEWYSVELAVLSPTAPHPPWDVVLATHAGPMNKGFRRELYGDGDRFAASKRQLPRRDLIAAGLRKR